MQSDLKQYECTREIDGLSYTSQKMDAERGLEMLARAISILGEAGLRAVFLAFQGQLGAALDAPHLLSSSAVKLAQGVMGDSGFCREMLEGVTCDGVKIAGKTLPVDTNVAQHFKRHFAGEYLHLAKVLAFKLSHDYAGPTLGSLSTFSSESPTPDEDSSAE